MVETKLSRALLSFTHYLLATGASEVGAINKSTFIVDQMVHTHSHSSLRVVFQDLWGLRRLSRREDKVLTTHTVHGTIYTSAIKTREQRNVIRMSVHRIIIAMQCTSYNFNEIFTLCVSGRRGIHFGNNLPTHPVENFPFGSFCGTKGARPLFP